MPNDSDETGQGWRDVAFRVAFGLESRVDAVRGRWRRSRGDAVVAPYLGYGDGRRVRVRGRVLRDLPVDPADPTDGPFTNLAAAWRRFASAEIAGATVAVSLADRPGEVRAVADEEGFLDVVLEPDPPLAPGRHAVRLRVLDPAPSDEEVHAGELRVADLNAPFGVISDIDDTVLVSDATQALRVLARTLLQNVHQRVPFPGAPELYAALGRRGAPFFYVSSSPWNLHAPLTRFLELQACPSGPLLLRDWGLSTGAGGGSGHAGHKREAIDAVLDVVPDLRFLLIGDSGQEDPEIYAALVGERRERVLGVLIRDVSDRRRDEAVDRLAAVAERAGVPFRRVADSAEAARVCEEAGWIDADARASVEAAVRDATSPTDAQDDPG